MERKLVFFDIDGTLYNKKQEVPASTIEAIKRLKEKEIHVAIATGRPSFMFQDLLETLGIESFISNNGQYAVHNGEVVHTFPIKTELLRNLSEHAKKNQHPLVFVGENEFRASMKAHQSIQESFASVKYDYPEVNENFFEEQDIYQALLFCQQEEEAEYEHHKEHLHLIRWHPLSMDIIPRGGSKAAGIEKMLAHLDIPKEQSYAFGDGLNDIEMLEFVGTGIAMGNGHERAKKAANFVTKSVEEDGILWGLRQLGLL